MTWQPGGTDGAIARLVADLKQAMSREDVFDALLAEALQVTRATRAAIVERDSLDALHVVQHVNADLPDNMVIGDVRAQLWAVLLGRTTLSWSEDEEIPQPFHGVPGWSTGMAVRLPARSGHPKLLIVGGLGQQDGEPPNDGQSAADIACHTASLIETLAAMTAPVADNLDLLAASRRTRALLRRVTALAGQLTTADSPAELLNRLVDGLVSNDVIDRATVWILGDGPGGIIAEADRQQVRSGDSEDLLTAASRRRIHRMLQPDIGTAMQQLLSDAARLPDGRLLSLLPIPGTGDRVLGVVHPLPLDPDSREVFATLTESIGPALLQAHIRRERQSLIVGLGDVLRPHVRPAAIDIGTEYHPNTTAAEAFGGDFYDWFEPRHDRVMVAMGDVSGKGIAAAAAASMAVWSLRAIGGQGPAPSMVAHLLDKVVSGQVGDDRFVTLCLADVNTDSWRIRLVVAGHPVPLLLGPGEPAPAIVSDRPLGVWVDGPAFSTHEITLGEGQVLVLFTDGITEAESPGGGRMGRDEIVAAAQDAYGDGTRTAGEVARVLWTSVQAWASGSPDDDCAIIVLRRP